MSVSLTALLAVVAIVLGVVGEIVDERLLLGTLEWFVLAIALNTLHVDYVLGRKVKP